MDKRSALDASFWPTLGKRYNAELLNGQGHNDLVIHIQDNITGSMVHYIFHG